MVISSAEWINYMQKFFVLAYCPWHKSMNFRTIICFLIYILYILIVKHLENNLVTLEAGNEGGKMLCVGYLPHSSLHDELWLESTQGGSFPSLKGKGKKIQEWMVTGYFDSIEVLITLVWASSPFLKTLLLWITLKFEYFCCTWYGVNNMLVSDFYRHCFVIYSWHLFRLLNWFFMMLLILLQRISLGEQRLKLDMYFNTLWIRTCTKRIGQLNHMNLV